MFTSPATYSRIAEFRPYRSVKCVNLRGTVKYVIVAYAIVHAAVSHSSAESNYVSTDNTALCACEIEKTMKTADNEGLGSLRVKQGRDSILIKSVNKSTMFHFSPITVVKEGERGGGICMPVYARGSQRGCLSPVSVSLSGKFCCEWTTKCNNVTQSLIISSTGKQNMRCGNQGAREWDRGEEMKEWKWERGECLSLQT